MICFSEKSAHFYAIALLQDFGHITFADRYKFFYAAVNGTPEPHIFRLFRWYVSFNSDHSPDDSPPPRNGGSAICLYCCLIVKFYISSRSVIMRHDLFKRICDHRQLILRQHQPLKTAYHQIIKNDLFGNFATGYAVFIFRHSPERLSVHGLPPA